MTEKPLQKLDPNNPQSCKDFIFKILEIMEDAEKEKQKRESENASQSPTPTQK